MMSATPDPMKCWICRANDATTGEHKIKHSDLRGVFGRAIPPGVCYYHDPQKPNVPVQSFGADILKAPILICAHCNNTRTQPHDQAWEEMSANLRARRPFTVGSVVRGNRIFPSDTARKLRNVHFYFLKQFGTMLVETDRKALIDVAPFADAIMKGSPHSEVYLQCGKGNGTVGRSNLECIKTENGHVLALWLYRVGPLTVNVIFAQEGGRWEGLDKTWHPRFGTNRLTIADFTGPPSSADELAAEA